MKTNNPVMMTVTTPEFQSWYAKVVAMQTEYMTKTFPSLQIPKMEIKDGGRYIRIFKDSSAHVFIDKTNGDVLKPATWAAPAKHARGNLFDASNGMGWMGPYGPAY